MDYSLDIVFQYFQSKQIGNITHELLKASRRELDEKWENLNSVREKHQNASINKQIIVDFLEKLADLEHNTGREICFDLFTSAKNEYDYLKNYCELVKYVKKPSTQMENRNSKSVPGKVSEQEKKLPDVQRKKSSSCSTFKRNKSKQPTVNANNELSLCTNNTPRAQVTEEQGPDEIVEHSVLADTDNKKDETIPNDIPVQGRSSIVSSGINTAQKDANLEINSTECMVQTTSLSENSGPTEISKAYYSLYQAEWQRLFKSIKEKNSESSSIKFLMDILKSTYRTCLENADRQIEMMMKEATDVVRGEKSEISKKNMQGDIELLKAYRRRYSLMSLSYLNQKFFSTQLPKLQQNCQRDQLTSNYLQTFISKCVEVAWHACISDPPMVLDFDFKPKSVEEVDQTVTSFKAGQKGKRIQYIVWPPLRRHENGLVICKGVAVLM